MDNPNTPIETKNYVKQKSPKKQGKTPLALLLVVSFLLGVIVGSGAMIGLFNLKFPASNGSINNGTSLTDTTTWPPLTSGSIAIDYTTTQRPNPESEHGLTTRYGFEDIDFGGYTFNFAAPIDDTDGWASYEVYAEESSGEILDEAINQRNNVMLTNYNCHITVEAMSLGNISNDFATGKCTVDVALYKSNMQTKASSNYINFHTLDIDYDTPWWNTGFIEDATVNEQIYTMLGAFSLTSFDATWVMFFNKTVKESNDQLRNIDFYELVYEGKWTLDEFYRLVKMAAFEDGDDQMALGTDDVFGLVSSTYGIRGLYFGANQGYIIQNVAYDGTSSFTHGFTQASVEATNKIIEIYHDSAVTTANYVQVESQMRSNTVLFAPEVLRKASQYAGKSGSSTEAIDFGILPHPALNEKQAQSMDFSHYFDNHAIYMCIPSTCKDIDRITAFIDLYAYHSYYTVYKEYLNLYQYEYTTDSDSAVMVDVILNSHSFDLAYQYNFASIDSEYIRSVQNGTNKASELGAMYGGAIVESANAYRNKLPGNR